METKFNEVEVAAECSRDLVSEGRRSASMGRSCEGCGEPLTGKKERFCSDRCRMRIYRKEQQARIGDLLTSIEHFAAELRKELEAPSGL